jgi:hypothetical protein
MLNGNKGWRQKEICSDLHIEGKKSVISGDKTLLYLHKPETTCRVITESPD